jgi:hypothetical protein
MVNNICRSFNISHSSFNKRKLIHNFSLKE